MLQLLDELLAPVTDRRREQRCQSTFGTVCYLDRTPSEHTTGLVWDISTGGLGLLLPFAPTTGMTFPLLLTTEDGREALSVAVRVSHVRQLSTGDFFVGGRFARTLSAAEIEPFVTSDAGRPQPPLGSVPLRAVRRAAPTVNSTWVNRSRRRLHPTRPRSGCSVAEDDLPGRQSLMLWTICRNTAAALGRSAGRVFRMRGD